MVYIQFLALVIFLIFYVWFFSSHRDKKKREKILKLLAEGAFILDVRNSNEYKAHHFKGAVNIPLEKLYVKKDKLPKEKDKSILVYCRSGGSATKAVKVLKSLGYKKIYNGGGLFAMSRLGLESKEELEESKES